jgi:ABC-type transport system involved in cytochrome c biogenesis permease component
VSTNYIFTSIWFAAALIYLLPTLIAFYRHANSVWPIAVLNLLLGWTLIMWFGASVWAMTDKTHSR